MNIFDVVIGSNHFLIQPQTVGKKAGAPMIYEVLENEKHGVLWRLTKILSRVSG
jgi:hypothetical protein